MPHVDIFALGTDQTVAFAAAEMRKYLSRISSDTVSVAARQAYSPDEPGIWLGCSGAFGSHFVPPTDERDDCVLLKSVGSTQLLLSGPNPRSVLFSVYAYLENLGCRWVRMGEDGEILPSNVAVRLAGYDTCEYASYRYRGICIEGGVSIEHATSMVNYMTKRRFNAYFIQFQNAYNFWSRWYDRQRGEPELPVEQAESYTEQLVAEVKKRGLSLQMVGHGWTCECLDVPGLGWIKTDAVLPAAQQRWLAEVDGKREWWGGIPINTELCLSNPQAFNCLVDYIVGYAGQHPQVDVLHVWMSDGSNNRCECPACSQKLPSDWYVDVLNAIDERMAARGIDTKVVFLNYVDLLWAPQQSAIKNPDRFILMFAPISRTYRNALLESPAVQEEPQPYRRNKNRFPRSTAANIHYLREWQKLFTGDGFTFDYHLLWKHSILEPTGIFISKVLHQDIVDTQELGLQGVMNCQVQRYFFPTGLTMEVSGRTMWARETPWASIATDYFAAAFGADGAQIQQQLERLCSLSDSDLLFAPRPAPAPAYQAALQAAACTLAEMRSFVEERLATASQLNSGVLASFRYLQLGLEFMEILLPGLQGSAAGEPHELSKAYLAAGDFLVAHEAELHEACDCTMWKAWLGNYAREAERVAEAG